MSIKQVKLIVNAHKHNLLNSFCNNGYVYVKQHENNNKNLSKIKRESAFMPVTVEFVIPWQNDRTGQ